MKKLWLLFSQVVTVLLACLFVLFVLFASGKEEMAMPTPPPDTLRSAAKAAAPAVVSIIINPEQPTTFTKTRNSKAQARPVGEDDEDEDVRKAVVNKLSDEKLIFDTFKDDEDEDVRKTVKDKLL